jgi:hypothetical protein
LTFERDGREATVGCSADWPARKRVAAGVRMTRVERAGWWARAEMMTA